MAPKLGEPGQVVQSMLSVVVLTMTLPRYFEKLGDLRIPLGNGAEAARDIGGFHSTSAGQLTGPFSAIGSGTLGFSTAVDSE